MGGPIESLYELTPIKTERPRSFWDEVTQVQNNLSDMEAAINEVQRAQEASLNYEGNDEVAPQHQWPTTANAQRNHVDAATLAARSLSNTTKVQIQQLATRAHPLPPGKERQTQQSQIAALRTRFKDHVQRYTVLESSYRNKVRARADRQFHLIRPEATPAEVEAALDESNDGIFAQALVRSYSTGHRQGSANDALRRVQDRHAEIRKIEETIAELAQLLNDVDVLLSEQEEQVDLITSNAQDTARFIDGGMDQTRQAVNKAERARKWRKMCFWVIIIFMIIATIAVIGAVCGSGACSRH